MKIRAKTFEAWLRRNFTKTNLRAMASNGVEGGWEGLTYYADTTQLYAKFKAEIWDYIIEENTHLEYPNIFAYLAQFRQAVSIEDVVTMENFLVWYVAENIAYRISYG